MTTIHPTAIVAPSVKLGDNVQVGPHTVIEGDVTIGRGTIVRDHCHIEGSTIIGEDCRIGPAAYVGLDAQHLRFKADPTNPTYARIGNRVTIREGASVHRAINPGIEKATTIGDDCYFMGQSHVGHDCVLADHVIMANGVLLGGHCTIGPNVFMGGGSVVHQFCRIGKYVIVGGNEAVTRDVPPFGAVWGARLKGYNAVGCRRSGMNRQAIVSIRGAYQQLHTHRTMSAAVAAIRAEVPDTAEVREILEFIAATKRGIVPSAARGDVEDTPE
ncbi:MAG: acyl-ACP--UDP-N-acetylglucosamine O-acyltransferase [Phycisphaerae bacterium]|nr:acyl-ACP--UDP-N-acetylglucosamine O-acyltransferase [Phycisphaerae bacterium]